MKTQIGKYQIVPRYVKDKKVRVTNIATKYIVCVQTETKKHFLGFHVYNRIKLEPVDRHGKPTCDTLAKVYDTEIEAFKAVKEFNI